MERYNNNLKRGKRSWIFRAISLLIVLSFLFQEISYANPELKPISWNFIPKPSINFDLPQSVALIEDSYKGTDPKIVILVQDAHTNDSGQMNISKALEIILGKEKIKYVFLEAGTGDDSLSFLRDKAPLDNRKEVAAEFLKKGLLSGSENLDLTSDLNFKLWGVENKELYWKSVDVYRKVAEGRDKFQDYLKRIEQTIDTLQPRIFNPSLMAFDQKAQSYLKEEIALTDYFEILAGEAQKRSISLIYYPHLNSLKNVLEKEKTIDFKKANAEQQKAIQTFSKEDLELLVLAQKENQNSPFKLSAGDHKTQKAFYALLEEKLEAVIARSAEGTNSDVISTNEVRRNPKNEISRFARNDLAALYPELSKYFDYLKAAEIIDAKKLLAEQKLLENQIYASLTTNEDEAKLHQVTVSLRNLKNLFNLTLTPDEFETYKADPKAFDIVFITGFLNKKIMDLKSYYERAVFLEGGYEDFVKMAQEFYTLTEQRDREFLKNMFAKMKEESQDKGVLITGGYHSPSLKALLKKENISYICVTPQILNETNQKRYEKILLSQRPAGPQPAAAPQMVSDKKDTLAILPIKENGSFAALTGRFSAEPLKQAGARLAATPEAFKMADVRVWLAIDDDKKLSVIVDAFFPGNPKAGRVRQEFDLKEASFPFPINIGRSNKEGVNHVVVPGTNNALQKVSEKHAPTHSGRKWRSVC